MIVSITEAGLAQAPCAFYENALKAEYYYRTNAISGKAIPFYLTAFQGKVCDASKILSAITNASLIKDTATVVQFLEKGISIGFKPSDFKRLWEHIGNGLEFPSLINEIHIRPIRAAYRRQLNAPLLAQLKKLDKRDQKYRSQDAPDMNAQNHLDSLNWMALKEIVLARNRLPTYTEIGIEGAEHMELIFYHMNRTELEWFLPYVLEQILAAESSLGQTYLYQLDRIGMDEGVIYTISPQLHIEKLAERTQLKNQYWCQAYGEWFDEKSASNNQVYETPFDPQITMEESNRIRALFCLDDIVSRRDRRPWVNIVSAATFEALVKE